MTIAQHLIGTLREMRTAKHWARLTSPVRPEPEADTKLIISWQVGPRDAGTATGFMQDVRERLANRVQLTTDGLRAYLAAVEDAFGADIDYAMLDKLYGPVDSANRCDPILPLLDLSDCQERLVGLHIHHTSAYQTPQETIKNAKLILRIAAMFCPLILGWM